VVRRERHARAEGARRLTRAELRRLWPPLIRNTPTVRQATFALLVGLGGFLASGVLLASTTNVLLQVPGLIALMPASNALRGDIFGPLGARLGTYLHTGMLRARLRRSRVLDENLLAASTQSLLMAFLLTGFTWATLKTLGAEVVGIDALLFVAVVAAAVAGSVLSVVAFVISTVAFRRGLDPDNVNAPFIAAGGDVLSVLLIVSMGTLLLQTDFSPWIVWPVDVAAVALVAYLTMRALSPARRIAREIVRQSMPVLVATVVLGLVVGLTLEASLGWLAATPALLLLVPPFLGQSGNLASIFGSRLTSAVHLGITRVGRRPDRAALSDIRDLTGVAVTVYLAVGAAGFAVAWAAGIATPPLGSMVALTLVAGILTWAILIPLVYYATAVSFRIGVNPDNVVIPVTNSSLDAAGILILLGIIQLLGLV
jgi:mgtE-like transporter